MTAAATLGCMCRFCTRADHWFRQEAAHAAASHAAQRRHDLETAKQEDAQRVACLANAARCIERCQGSRKGAR